MNSATRTYRKRIPYGIMNFEVMRRDDCYYVDKTHFIEEVELANKFFFFIRPRRFGKSLLLNMLRHYYDVNEAKHFENLFGGLYIGKHPTRERNSFLVISLNFSVIDAGMNNYRRGLDAHCNQKFNLFCDRYRHLLPEGAKEEMNRNEGAVKQLGYLCDACMQKGLKIYLFIDEYDHFTNKILGEPGYLTDYCKETHGEGYLRLFFDAVKAGTDSAIDRVFVTGVSPVTMDDLTSGFNIGTNYTLDAAFNEMVGFTEAEVRSMLAYYASVCTFHHSVDELVRLMKPWYDNYCFADNAYGHASMYNSNMVLYFIDNYIRNDGQLPKYMVEDNIRMDYNKLRMLIRHDKAFDHDAKIIEQLVTNGFITGELKKGFPAEMINHPDNFISLLYYFGLITIGGTSRGKTKFIIPNEVVREQIYAYLLSTYEENDLRTDSYQIGELCSGMAYDGHWQPYFQYIADTLKSYASQRDKQKGEAFVHGFTLALTCQNPFYRPISELDNQAGYADIFLCPLVDIYADIQHSYIVELKYAKAGDNDKHISQLQQEAQLQVARYAASERVKQLLGSTKLHRLVIVFRGTDMAVCEEV